jgi:phage I-like protein
MKFPWEKDYVPPEKKEDEIELKPSDVKAKLDSIDELKKNQEAQSEKLKSLDTITGWIQKQEAKENQVAREKQEADRKKVKEDEAEELDWALDPEKATKTLLANTLNETLRPMQLSILNTNAKNLAAERFSDQAFEYYSDPTFKSEVDKLISGLPPASKGNMEAIENCYHVVYGRKAADIKEGKIKSRFASTSSSGNGTGAPSSKSEEVMTLTEDQKKAAKMFGMSEKDYATGFKKENAYV